MIPQDAPLTDIDFLHDPVCCRHDGDFATIVQNCRDLLAAMDDFTLLLVDNKHLRSRGALHGESACLALDGGGGGSGNRF